MQKAKKRLSELRRSISTKKIDENGQEHTLVIKEISPRSEQEEEEEQEEKEVDNKKNKKKCTVNELSLMLSGSTISPSSSSSTLLSPMRLSPDSSKLSTLIEDEPNYSLDLSRVVSMIHTNSGGECTLSPESISPTTYEGPAITKYLQDGYVVNHPKMPLNRENVGFCFMCEANFPTHRTEKNLFDLLVPTGKKLDTLIYREIFVCDACYPGIATTRKNDQDALINISYKARMLFREFRQIH